MTDRILVGRIGAPSGVRGEVRLISFTADPLAIADYASLQFDDGASAVVEAVRPQGKLLVARLRAVTSREAAAALTNRELFILRSDLPAAEDEDEFYLADLIGMTARDEAGEEVGQVIAVHDFGAGDILEIAPAGRTSFMLAFTRANVPSVDLDGQVVTVIRPVETEGERDPSIEAPAIGADEPRD